MGRFIDFITDRGRTASKVKTKMRGGMIFHFVRLRNSDGELTDDYKLVKVTDGDGRRVSIDDSVSTVNKREIDNAFDEINPTLDIICGITLPKTYRLRDFNVKPLQRVGKVVRSKDGNIKVKIPPQDENLSLEEFFNKVYTTEYKKYKKVSGNDIRFYDFLKYSYGKIDINKVEDQANLRKHLSKLENGQHLEIYHLDGDSSKNILIKRPGSKYMLMLDPNTMDWTRVRSSAIQKVNDDTYRVTNPKNMRYANAKIDLAKITGTIDRALIDQKGIERWQKKELKIARNLYDIFNSKDRLFTQHPVDVVVKQQGGGNKSDVVVRNRKTSKEFYIESKLNYTSGEYFKFNLNLFDSKLQHVPATGDTSRNERLSEIFGSDSKEQAQSFLGLLMGSGETKTIISSQIDQFYANIEIFLNEINQWIQKSDQTELNKIKAEFFEDVTQLYTKESNVKKMKFPGVLGDLVKCFIGYIQFIKYMKDERDKINEKDEQNTDPINELYKQLLVNLNVLIKQKNLGDVEKFIDGFKSSLTKTDDNGFVYIYRSVMSSVKRLDGDEYNLMLFSDSCDGLVPKLVQKINDYYANVHDARYIEIGSNPFKDDTPFNSNTWHSDIYVLEPNDKSDIEQDPLQLMKNKAISVRPISDLGKIKKARVYCAVSNDMKHFELKFFLGSSANQRQGAVPTNGKVTSFEDLNNITIMGNSNFFFEG